MRERLLRENDLTLDRASEMVQAAEVTADQMHVMSGEQTVSAVETQYGRGQGRKGHQGHKQFRHPVKKPGAQCKYCPYEHAPKSCPAYGKQCRKCGKMNHFQSKCKHRLVKQIHSSVSDNDYNVGTITTVNSVGNKRRAMITLKLGDSSVPVTLQTAACCRVPSMCVSLEIQRWPN